MANKNVHLQESISIKDEVSAMSSLNPSVIRDEFELYRSKLTPDSKPGEFIVSYVVLQVYIENHFHYYLRFLIGDGFTSGEVRDCWKEVDQPPYKIKCFKKVLESNKIEFSNNSFENILNNYKILTDARNALAHGHPITKTYTGGSVEESKTRKLLTFDSFNEITEYTNKLIQSWNALMDELLEQEERCKIAKLPQGGFFDHCKFKNPL